MVISAENIARFRCPLAINVHSEVEQYRYRLPQEQLCGPESGLELHKQQLSLNNVEINNGAILLCFKHAKAKKIRYEGVFFFVCLFGKYYIWLIHEPFVVELRDHGTTRSRA